MSSQQADRRVRLGPLGLVQCEEDIDRPQHPNRKALFDFPRHFQDFAISGSEEVRICCNGVCELTAVRFILIRPSGGHEIFQLGVNLMPPIAGGSQLNKEPPP
jgi:hypothetical protein